MKVACQNTDVLRTLKMHIAMGLETKEQEDKALEIQIRIAEIETEFNKMLESISVETVENFDETKAKELLNEKENLQKQLTLMADVKQKRESEKSRLDEIYTVIDGLKNHPLTYDDEMIRRILECVIVESKEKIKVIFKGGLEVESNLNN